VIAYLANGVANALPATLFLLFAGDVLGAGEQAGAFLLLYFLSAIASVPLWLRAAKLWGKHRSWCFSMLAACGVFAFVPFLSSGDQAAFLAICLLTGLCFGADLALPASMQADVVDVDTLGALRTLVGEQDFGVFATVVEGGRIAPGDRVEVVHGVTVGSSAKWSTTTVGKVLRTERRRHGLHFRRNPDDKVYSDVLILSRDDGELTTVTIDEYTRLRRL
jgi:hypothetical protein